MVLIQEREVIRKIPIFVTKGMNKGKLVGHIYFEKNKLPYYFVQKRARAEQIYKHPKHIGKLSVSTTILEDLKKYGVANIIFMMIGFEEKSFYVVVPLNDYNNASADYFDDVQKYTWLKDYTRIYPEQGSLKKFIF